MILHRQARELHVVEIVTDPPTAISAWEASYDDGVTWVPPVTAGARTGWLLAGPACTEAPAAGQVTITRTVTPLFRLRDKPELVIRDGPQVILT